MSNKFTRNITNIKNVNEQGLETNNQNDLLSQEDGNVFVRTLDYYHNLTDNIKNINGNTVTMNDGNKLVLPIIISVNHYEQGKHFIKLVVFGDLSKDYAMSKGRYSERVRGKYDSEYNVTTFIVEVVANSNNYKQVRMGIILPPENEGDGEGFIPLYEIDTLYMNATDYNVTDKLSPKYLLGRELIATKKELSDTKNELQKAINTVDKKFNIKNAQIFNSGDKKELLVLYEGVEKPFDIYIQDDTGEELFKKLGHTPISNDGSVTTYERFTLENTSLINWIFIVEEGTEPTFSNKGNLWVSVQNSDSFSTPNTNTSN